MGEDRFGGARLSTYVAVLGESSEPQRRRHPCGVAMRSPHSSIPTPWVFAVYFSVRIINNTPYSALLSGDECNILAMIQYASGCS